MSWLPALHHHSIAELTTHHALMFLAATKQLLEHFCLSVCLSVRPSVTPFSLCSYHRIIMKFSGVNINDKSDVHTKGQGQRSKVKVTEVKTQLSLFRTLQFEFTYGDEMMHKAYCCLGEVPYCFSRSSIKFRDHTAKKNRRFLTQIRCFQTVTPVWIQWWLWNDKTRDKKSLIFTRIVRFRTVTLVWIYWWLSNDAQSLKQHRRGVVMFFKVIHQMSRSHGTKNHQFLPKLSVSGL